MAVLLLRFMLMLSLWLLLLPSIARFDVFFTNFGFSTRFLGLTSPPPYLYFFEFFIEVLIYRKAASLCRSSIRASVCVPLHVHTAGTTNLRAVAKLVAPHVQHLQPFEVAATLREPAELVVRKVQITQPGELAEALWEAAELVATKFQSPQHGELTDGLREVAELVV